MAFRNTVSVLTVTTALRRCTKGADYNNNRTHNQYESNKFYVFVIISWARKFILMQRVTVDHWPNNLMLKSASNILIKVRLTWRSIIRFMVNVAMWKMYNLSWTWTKRETQPLIIITKKKNKNTTIPCEMNEKEHENEEEMRRCGVDLIWCKLLINKQQQKVIVFMVFLCGVPSLRSVFFLTNMHLEEDAVLYFSCTQYQP